MISVALVGLGKPFGQNYVRILVHKMLYQHESPDSIASARLDFGDMLLFVSLFVTSVTGWQAKTSIAIVFLCSAYRTPVEPRHKHLQAIQKDGSSGTSATPN